MQLHLSQPNLATHQCFCLLQCRQKTVEVKRQCSTCTQQFCPKCLTNRYGPGQEQVSQAAKDSMETTPSCMLPPLLQQLTMQLALPTSFSQLSCHQPILCNVLSKGTALALPQRLAWYIIVECNSLSAYLIYALEMFLMLWCWSCSRVSLLHRLPSNPIGAAQNARRTAVAATAAR